MAAALARALLPAEADDRPPEWLRPDQRLSFARALAAVRRYGGALLADAIGTGKSFVGLAVAAASEPGATVHVLAPAALLPQWRQVAARSGVVVRGHSHESISRGRLPGREPGPVLIDESHRFRNPLTRRYGLLAPWCIGRRGLLLSATPLVNRLEELSAQLLLLVRDDALAGRGIASLRGLAAPLPVAELAELVVTGEDRTVARPAAVSRWLRPEEPRGSSVLTLLAGLGTLRLSADRGIRRLLRGLLLGSLASSPLALAETLARYRSLLLHARDAAAAGRPLARGQLRRCIGASPEQLVLWPLVAEPASSIELALEDLEPAGELAASARHGAEHCDAKALALRELLLDQCATLVFSTATATVRYLRRHFPRGTAWCTGDAAGLDSARCPREQVLDWFRRPSVATECKRDPPRLLLATDVASEGLDLPLVRRVVHYDLPWTAVRLQQRSGRALRLGSPHPRVEEIGFLPPEPLAAELRREAILDGKASLPQQLGLGDARNAPWRLRAAIARGWESITAQEGVAWLAGAGSSLVVAYRVQLSTGAEHVFVRAHTAGGWSGDPSVIAPLLDLAREVSRVMPLPAPRLARTLRVAAMPLRGILRTLHAGRLASSGTRAVRLARQRLLALSRDAARRRDLHRLALLERGLALLRRGHTAGEALRIEAWAALPASALLALLAELPAQAPGCEATHLELVGVLLLPSRAGDR